MVVAALGEVIFDEKSRIYYRQHSSNVVGIKTQFTSKWILRIKRFLLNKDRHIRIRQAKELFRIFGGSISSEKRKILFSALAVSKSGHMRLLNASLRLRFANSALAPLDLLLNIILIVHFALMMATLALIAFTPPHVEIA